MTTYSCNVCSNSNDGEMVFNLVWTESVEDPTATRCPKCGEIYEFVEV